MSPITKKAFQKRNKCYLKNKFLSPNITLNPIKCKESKGWSDKFTLSLKQLKKNNELMSWPFSFFVFNCAKIEIKYTEKILFHTNQVSGLIFRQFLELFPIRKVFIKSTPIDELFLLIFFFSVSLLVTGLKLLVIFLPTNHSR